MRIAGKIIQSFTGLLLVMSPALARAADQELPDGAGKVPLQRICSACHAAEIVVGKHETKERWDEIVSNMVEKGAVGTDEEFNQIVEYLAANFGKAGSSAKPAVRVDLSRSGTFCCDWLPSQTNKYQTPSPSPATTTETTSRAAKRPE